MQVSARKFLLYNFLHYWNATSLRRESKARLSAISFFFLTSSFIVLVLFIMLASYPLTYQYVILLREESKKTKNLSQWNK